MTQHVLITGCSGGGKSTLTDALGKRGHSVVPEPGLRIVQEEKARGGTALPWIDAAAFLWRAVEVAQDDLTRMAHKAFPVFHDRGLLDAAVGLEDLCGVPIRDTLKHGFPYANRVVLAPPWPEIFATTEDRQHGFEAATIEYDRIRSALSELGCEALALPRVDLETRLRIVENAFDL